VATLKAKKLSLFNTLQVSLQPQFASSQSLFYPQPSQFITPGPFTQHPGYYPTARATAAHAGQGVSMMVHMNTMNPQATVSYPYQEATPHKLMTTVYAQSASQHRY
jgi:hypothetical protein